MIEIFLYSALVIFLYMNFWFLLSLILKRNDIADVAWGLGFVNLVIFLYFQYGANNFNFLLVFTLTFIWGIRLSTHIFLRNKSKKEDLRYVAFKKSWGSWFFVRSYLQVFVLQGFFMFLISFSAILSSLSKVSSINFFVLLGFLTWVIGFIFESVGDNQLNNFLKNHKNKQKIMRYGLWKYTRHPNYFGEVTQWWGIFLIVASLPYGIYAILSPLTITFLILKVSGIPMLEKPFLNNHEFIEYKKSTSAFFPWFYKGK